MFQDNIFYLSHERVTKRMTIIVCAQSDYNTKELYRKPKNISTTTFPLFFSQSFLGFFVQLLNSQRQTQILCFFFFFGFVLEWQTCPAVHSFSRHTVILQIFGVVLFSVFSVVDGFTEIKKTPK